MSRIARTGYRASRPEFLGVRAITREDGTRVVEEHGEAFSATKAALTQVGPVRVDFGGARTILARLPTFVRYDQLRLGACVCNSGCAGVKLVSAEEIDPSRLDAYQKCLMGDGSWPNDDGTTAERFHRVVADPGICRESLHPYTDATKEWTKRSSIEALEDGYDHRIDATHRITSTGAQRGADIRASINAGRPVMIGGPVSKAFEAYFDEFHPTVIAFDNLLPSEGGHEQLCVGYWRQANGSHLYLILNSWGDQGGLTEFPGCSWYTERAIGQQDECFSVFKAPKF